MLQIHDDRQSYIANRISEIELFNKIVQGERDKRILLIKAEEGLGKTSLLGRFHKILPDNILSVRIDLKAAERGIPYILYFIRRRLKSERFTLLNAAVQKYLSGGIEVSDTTIIGEDNQFSVVLSDIDEIKRNYRLSELQDKFFQDLRKINQPLVFLFDSYEKAPQELANWLEGEFLGEVVDIEKLVVVIAGQEIPKPTIQWMNLSQCVDLEAILEENAWYEYAEKVESCLNKDQIRVLMLAYHGKPISIVSALERVSEPEKQYQNRKKSE